MESSGGEIGETSRRGVISTVLMVVGVVAGYGAGAVHFFRYLVPLRRPPKREMFVGTLADFPVGASRTVRDPRGQEVAITRVSASGDDPAAGFRALSTRCPHLGCKAHWEEAGQRFRCPCHEGIFDKEGRAVSGPPAAEGKNLGTYEVRVDAASGWVMVMVGQEHRYGV